MSQADSTKSDEELMEMYKLGEIEAFDTLFKRHSGRVLGFLSKKLNSHKDAQDLTQDVFLKLHRSRHLFDSNLRFTPWLFSVTRTIWIDYVRKKQGVHIEFNETYAPAVVHNDSDLFADLLKNLPLQQGEAVELRFYKDASFEEIASRLSTSPENARQLVSRGLKNLKKVLGKA